MTTKLITNQDTSNHLDELKKLFNGSDEIWMATAFLKMSGLKSLAPLIKKHVQDGKKINIIAGQNFGLTEPEALNHLRLLFKNKTNAKVHLAFAKKVNEVFHPKLFVFKQGAHCTIVSGSANITSGGLVSNFESSLCVKVSVADLVFKETIVFFDRLFSTECSEEVDLTVLKRYTSYYNVMRKHNSRSIVIPPKIKSVIAFDKLLTSFVKFDNDDRTINYEKRYEDYNKALKLLNEISKIKDITKTKFEPLLDELITKKAGHVAYWKSSGLSRGKNKKNGKRGILYHGKEFQNLIEFVRKNHKKDIGFVFDGGKRIISRIPGAGVNYLTEILMTYDCKKYANLNNNPLTVLNLELGLGFNKDANSYTGQEYADYCEVVLEIIKKYSLRNCLEIDSFFNEVYWPLKEKLKKAK